MSFLEEQCSLPQDLIAKIPMFDKKLNASEASINKLNDKINNFEEKLAWFESQDELKSRKIDDFEYYESRESLRFSGFELKENKSKEESEHVAKS